MSNKNIPSQQAQPLQSNQNQLVSLPTPEPHRCSSNLDVPQNKRDKGVANSPQEQEETFSKMQNRPEQVGDRDRELETVQLKPKDEEQSIIQKLMKDKEQLEAQLINLKNSQKKQKEEKQSQIENLRKVFQQQIKNIQFLHLQISRLQQNFRDDILKKQNVVQEYISQSLKQKQDKKAIITEMSQTINQLQKSVQEWKQKLQQQNHKNQQRQEEIVSLTNQQKRLIFQKSKLCEDFNSQELNIKKLTQKCVDIQREYKLKLEENEIIISQQRKELQIMYVRMKQNQIENEQKLSVIEQLKRQRSQLMDQLKRLQHSQRIQLEEMQEEIDTLTKLVKEKEYKSELEMKINCQNFNQSQTFQQKIKQKEAQIRAMSEKIVQMQRNNQIKQKCIEQMKQLIALWKRKQQAWRDQAEKYSLQICRLEDERAKILDQNSTLKEVIDELHRQIKERGERKQESNYQLICQIQKYQKSIQKNRQYEKQLNKELDQQHRQVESLQKEIQELKKYCQRCTQQKKELQHRIQRQAEKFSGLFQNEVLENQPQHKKFLKQAIEDLIHTKIISTRLLYRYDPRNKVSFHSYIDEKENIVIVIKMKNGNYLAAYTMDPFVMDKKSQREGMLISLTNREVFTLRQPNVRAITYDTFYLIFGNSELRIRADDKRVFSNFGIINSYYKSRGFKVQVLLGSEERQSQMEHFQIYQLKLQERQ